MGDLAGTRAYLAGPIEHVSDSRDWRAEITPILSNMDIVVWDPIIKPDWMPDIDGEAQNKLKETILNKGTEAVQVHNRRVTFEKNQKIRESGLRLANAADFVICRITKQFTVGTFEELSEAKRSGKPVLFWTDEEIPSMWLLAQFQENDGEVGVFFTNLDDLSKYLEIIDSCEESRDPLKWIFLNWKDAANVPRNK